MYPFAGRFKQADPRSRTRGLPDGVEQARMELSLPLSAPRELSPRGQRAWAVIRPRRALELLRGNRLALRATGSSLVVLPLLAGGWLWLRDSSLVAVQHVHISGVHGAEAIEIRAALWTTRPSA